MTLLSFMVEEGPNQKNGFQTGSTTITNLVESATKKCKDTRKTLHSGIKSGIQVGIKSEIKIGIKTESK